MINKTEQSNKALNLNQNSLKGAQLICLDIFKISFVYTVSFNSLVHSPVVSFMVIVLDDHYRKNSNISLNEIAFIVVLL